METGEDRQRFFSVHHEHQRVRKPMQQGASNVPVDHRDLLWICADAMDRGGDLRAEDPAQAGALALIPILRVNQFRTGAGVKITR